MGKRKVKDAEIAAIEDLKRKIRIARSKGNFREVASLHNALGNQYRLLEHYEEALEQHQEEIKVCLKHVKDDRMGLGIAYRNVGEVFLDMKQEERAVLEIKKYLDIATELGNYVEQQRANITLGRAYLTISGDETRPEAVRKASNSKAYNYFKKAYNLTKEERLADQLGNEKELMLMKCNNCQNLGMAFEAMDNRKNAEIWLRKAIETGQKYGFHEYLAPCYSVLCGIYLKAGDAKNALGAAKNGTKSCKALGNVSMEVESLAQEAKALFASDDIEGGKKILKRLRQRIRKSKDLRDYLEEIDPLLIAAVKACRAQDSLYITEEGDAQRRMKLHETLGDNYTTLGNFREAISQYKKSAQYAEKLRISGKKLGRLYFSIAECYKDLEEYKEAYQYYLQEIVLYNGNTAEVSEEFKTQTSIASVLEKLDKPVDEIIAAHEAAVALAKMTKSFSKQVTAINNYGLYLQTIGKDKEAEKQLKIAQQIKDEHNVVDEEETDSQDLLEDEDDEVDLDNLSDDDCSDDEGDDDKKSRKRYNVRRNEVGETQLHLAAKKGELRRVIKLIREGHPVKVKDSAGWAPLHEAANFGHAQIVDELLKHGAEVNEFGGEGVADKITPLHDAASNGHCEVMKVLLKHGANVLAKDAKGRYPIDNLITWRESDDGKGASEQDLEAYHEMKAYMKDLMAKAGKAYGKERENKVKKLTSTQKKGPEMSLLVSKERDYDCPIPVTIITDNYDPDNEGGGTSLYMDTMMQIRKRKTEGPKNKERTREISPGPQGALIPAEQDVNNTNNWLLPDDMITTRDNEVVQLGSYSKRKRDSFDDTYSDRDHGRSRRRKISSGSSRRRRVSRSPESEDMDLDIFDSNHKPDEERPSSSESKNSPAPLSGDNDDEFLNDLGVSDLFNDVAMDVSSPNQVDDDFLPSQRPSDPVVEFGRTVDVPVDTHDESDEDIESPVISYRRNKSSPRKRTPSVINLFSDDEDFTPPSRRQNHQGRRSLSDIANVFKKVTAEQSRSNASSKASLIQSRLPVKVTFRNSDSIAGTSTSKIISPEGSREIRRTGSSTSLGSTSSRSAPFERSRGEVWRLKIRVLGGGEILLVPLEEAQQSESVDWLALECASRYLRQKGIKPLLQLQTKDGATLTGSDSINLALGDERELDAVVIGFDQPPLVDRYFTACGDEGIDPDEDIKSGLNLCQSSNVLDLTDNNLRGKAAPVLMKTLQRQISLRVLTLSGCSLFDAGVNELCRILPTLSGLMEVDLSSNGITSYGFDALSDAFNSNNQSYEASRGYVSNVPLGVVSLKINHNPLGNSIGKSLASLLDRLTALKCLEMANCNLTERLFSFNASDLTKALNNSHLEEVDISYNNLKSVGLEKFLQHLPARKMKSLKCSSCSLNAGDTSPEVIAKAICSFLSRNEDCCNLKTLQLNDCGLNDKAVDMILDNFDRLVRLDKLEMALNAEVTPLSVINILNRSVDSSLPLQELNFGDCINLLETFTDEELILNALENKMSSDKKLTYLKLPSCPVDPTKSESENIKNVSKLESRIISLMEDYAGSMHFTYEKRDSSIIFRFED